MLNGHGGFFGFGPDGQNELTFFTFEAYMGGTGMGTCHALHTSRWRRWTKSQLSESAHLKLRKWG
jgi:hypothetical protein